MMKNKLLKLMKENPNLSIRSIIVDDEADTVGKLDSVEVGTYWLWNGYAWTDKKDLLESIEESIANEGEDTIGLPHPDYDFDGYTNMLDKAVKETFDSLLEEKAILVTFIRISSKSTL